MKQVKLFATIFTFCGASASQGRIQQYLRRNLLGTEEEDLAKLGISGWWTACSYRVGPPYCRGNLIPTDALLAFDTTGQTSYINPYENGAKIVHWFAPPPVNDPLSWASKVVGYALYNREPFDIDCNADGLCTRDGIEVGQYR
jgi:hypothetical protein